MQFELKTFCDGKAEDRTSFEDMFFEVSETKAQSATHNIATITSSVSPEALSESTNHIYDHLS